MFVVRGAEQVSATRPRHGQAARNTWQDNFCLRKSAALRVARPPGWRHICVNPRPMEANLCLHPSHRRFGPRQILSHHVDPLRPRGRVPKRQRCLLPRVRETNLSSPTVHQECLCGGPQVQAHLSFEGADDQPRTVCTGPVAQLWAAPQPPATSWIPWCGLSERSETPCARVGGEAPPRPSGPPRHEPALLAPTTAWLGLLPFYGDVRGGTPSSPRSPSHGPLPAVGLPRGQTLLRSNDAAWLSQVSCFSESKQLGAPQRGRLGRKDRMPTGDPAHRSEVTHQAAGTANALLSDDGRNCFGFLRSGETARGVWCFRTPSNIPLLPWPTFGFVTQRRTRLSTHLRWLAENHVCLACWLGR